MRVLQKLPSRKAALISIHLSNTGMSTSYTFSCQEEKGLEIW